MNIYSFAYFTTERNFSFTMNERKDKSIFRFVRQKEILIGHLCRTEVIVNRCQGLQLHLECVLNKSDGDLLSSHKLFAFFKREKKMEKKYFIGIDSGTSRIKAVVIDFDGNELGKHGIDIPNVEDPLTCYSHDMNTVWDDAKVCIKEAIRKSEIDGAEIAGIGITAQGAGTWMIDADGEPTFPGICWCDGRSSDLARQMQEDGTARKVYDIVGNAVYPGSQGVQLRWLKENRPDVIEKTATIFHTKDWIFFKLTGIRSADSTDESLPFVNMENRQYEPESFRLHGIEELISKKPELKEPDENTGVILPELAEEFGLDEDTLVTGGPMDCIACPLGVGVIDPGQVCSTIGTAGIHVMAMDKPDFNPWMVAGNLTHAPRDRWLRLLDAISATPSIEWYIRQFEQGDIANAREQGMSEYEFMDKTIESIPIGCEGVIFHPYLAPGGERAPFVKTTAKGSFFGLGYQHTRAHLLRAVYEGVAYATLDCYEHFPMKIREIRMAGGGTGSPVWCQMFADMAGIPVMIPEGTEFGAKGAVQVTGVALGIYRDYNDAIEKTVKISRIYEPDMQKHEKYQKYYKLYLKLRQGFEELWDARADALK